MSRQIAMALRPRESPTWISSWNGSQALAEGLRDDSGGSSGGLACSPESVVTGSTGLAGLAGTGRPRGGRSAIAASFRYAETVSRRIPVAC